MGNIMLNIRGNQIFFGDFEDIDLTTAASLHVSDSKYIIKFCNEERTRTVITVEDDAVTLSHPGNDEAQILFMKDTPYTISYETEIGLMGINMYTTMVETDINDNRGKIEIEYLTELMGEQLVGKLCMSYAANDVKEDRYEN